MLLIAPTEPVQIRELGKTSSIPEKYGVDILFSANKQLIGIQRKQFPDDFLASLHDGRLNREISLMKQIKSILLLEGKPRWSLDGALITDNRQFTRRQLRGICWSIVFEFGIHVDFTDSITDTIFYIQWLKLYTEKNRHISLVRRPNLHDTWGGSLKGRDWAIYFLQGFSGIGPKLAEAIYDNLKIPLKWTCSKEDLARVLGKHRAERLWNALAGGNDRHRDGHKDGHGHVKKEDSR